MAGLAIYWSDPTDIPTLDQENKKVICLLKPRWLNIQLQKNELTQRTGSGRVPELLGPHEKKRPENIKILFLPMTNRDEKRY